ncbi:bifunctional adenosylcobinamide kinase/adenosylcobinamide-phosphate guanylyltransferase [Oscillospiraceae bacterium WX1]
MLTLVIGGAASGKSEYAESLAISLPLPRYYVATMMPFDKEDLLRIEKHRTMRAEKGFTTKERYTSLAGLRLPERGTVLLECLGNLTANELFAVGGAGDKTVEAVLSGVLALEQQCENLVIVTNDVFSDGVAYDPETARYIAALAAVNNVIAARCACIYELVCGIPLPLREAAL